MFQPRILHQHLRKAAGRGNARFTRLLDILYVRFFFVCASQRYLSSDCFNGSVKNDSVNLKTSQQNLFVVCILVLLACKTRCHFFLLFLFYLFQPRIQIGTPMLIFQFSRCWFLLRIALMHNCRVLAWCHFCLSQSLFLDRISVFIAEVISLESDLSWLCLHCWPPVDRNIKM